MATLGTSYPTLLEVSKLFTDDGAPLPVAELLTEVNEALDDIPFYEANMVGGHRIAVESGLPDAVWRKLNQGIVPTKGTTADVTEGVASLTSLGKVDALLAKMSGNIAAYRVRKNQRHMEGMNQRFMRTLFNGDSNLTPEGFLGFGPRFSAIAGPENGVQILDAGGTGSALQSIWLIGWGPGSVYGLYPKGTAAGIVHRDFGEELAIAPDGVGELPMFRDWFEWNCGVAVEDWRNVVRIANIDATTLTKNAAVGADLVDLMTQAVEMLGNRGAINPVFYVSRKARSFLRRQINNKANVWLSAGEVAGRKTTEFDGIPVRRVDALTATETRVV